MAELDIYILLGSNLGDREQHLATAIKMMEDDTCVIRSMSSIYKTAPWGKTDQPDFLNQVVGIETTLTAQELLKTLLHIETKLGRERKEKWGERSIDLDILFYNDQIITSKELTLPHPGVPSRRFTLVPLCEIAPDFTHPTLKLSCSALLNVCTDFSVVEKYK